MTDNEKILNLLTLIHQENTALMSVLLTVASYPQDYEKINKNTQKEWEEAFYRCIGEKKE